MNTVALIGRLTRDVELKYTQSNTAVCQFTIAVDRRFKSEGQPTADFIPIVAWKQTAEFIAKYFHKGNRIALTGRIQTRSWEGEGGKKCFATEVIAENVEFCESKQASSNNNYATTEAGYYDEVTPPPTPATATISAPATPSAQSGYFPVDDESDLPF